MHALWLQELESFEAISQDADTRDIFLRMAAMSQDGNMTRFLRDLANDRDIDEATKLTLNELAQDRSFLLAVEDYLRRTQVFH